jgi:hypothetical protein
LATRATEEIPQKTNGLKIIFDFILALTSIVRMLIKDMGW